MNRNGIFISVIIAIIGVTLLTYAFVQHQYAVSSPRTFNLGQFGIALTIPGSLSELTTVAHMSTTTGQVLHTYAGSECDLGALYEIQKSAIASSGTSWTKKTLEQFEVPQGSKPAQVKEFTDFYLVFEPNPDTCAKDASGQTMEKKKQLELWNALTTAHYMDS